VNEKEQMEKGIEEEVGKLLAKGWKNSFFLSKSLAVEQS
jgi:hypothetical protein